MMSNNFNVLQVAITFDDIREWCPLEWSDERCIDFFMEYSDVIRIEMELATKAQLQRCTDRDNWED
jgi:hypothetical protein